MRIWEQAASILETPRPLRVSFVRHKILCGAWRGWSGRKSSGFEFRRATNQNFSTMCGILILMALLILFFGWVGVLFDVILAIIIIAMRFRG